jgi:methionyl-tRNA formyltransferase
VATFFTGADGQPLRLVLADVREGAATTEAPGTVVAVDRGDPGSVTVACGQGTTLLVHRLIPEGRRPMTAGEFLRGSCLREGSQLGTPAIG